MNRQLRRDADTIIAQAIQAVLPDAAVKQTLEGRRFSGRVVLIAAGKAAWQMAKAAFDCAGEQIGQGVVITKYGHVKGPLPRTVCYEAGHPIPDENSFDAAETAIRAVQGLTDRDTVLFLLSGGGSALFEKPKVDRKELQDITEQLLACGADIVEMNILRKRLSQVKGGQFAKLCAPAKVVSIILSDILGDPLDMIASGPTVPDTTTCAQALAIVEKYQLHLSAFAMECLHRETPKELTNIETHVNGSVKELCRAAANACKTLDYEPFILTDQLCCQAKEAGSFLGSIAKTHSTDGKRLAFIAGGETVVKLTGHGLGGRNQEIALAAAKEISRIGNVCVFSVGSDGTDGPTDAAGGYADGDTEKELNKAGKGIDAALRENDAYHALQAANGLIFTGPTGTNVNDFAVVLVGENHPMTE